jgi:hypothetical protein
MLASAKCLGDKGGGAMRATMKAAGAAILLTLGLCAAPLRAQAPVPSWPQRTVHLIVPFGAVSKVALRVMDNTRV